MDPVPPMAMPTRMLIQQRQIQIKKSAFRLWRWRPLGNSPLGL